MARAGHASDQPPPAGPDPANPLLNPPTQPGHGPLDAPPRQPNELPGEAGEGPAPAGPGTPPRHPFSPPEPLPRA